MYILVIKIKIMCGTVVRLGFIYKSFRRFMCCVSWIGRKYIPLQTNGDEDLKRTSSEYILLGGESSGRQFPFQITKKGGGG